MPTARYIRERAAGAVLCSGAGQRQGDGQPQPAASAGVQTEAAAVRLGDRLDDGQPEPGSVARAGPLGAWAPEGLSELADVFGGQGGSAVFHDEAGLCLVGLSADANPASWPVVPDRVVDDVPDHAGQQGFAADDPGLRAGVVVDVESHTSDGVRAFLDGGGGYGAEPEGGLTL